MQNAASVISASQRSAGAKTATVAGSNRLTVAGHNISIRVFILAILGLLIPSVSTRAEEGIQTLALANYYSLSVYSFSAVKESLPVATSELLSAPSIQDSSAEPRQSFSEDLTLYTTTLFGDQSASGSTCLCLLTRPALPDGFSRVWDRFEAGYGQVFCDKEVSIYGRHGTGWQEPGCGYLKISFRF